MRRLALLALAAALASACSTKVDPTNPWDADTPEAQKAKARITGRILPVGMTVPGGLEVRLKQNGGLVDQTVTASDGSFVFNGLTPGAYVVESTPAGYVKFAEPVTLSAGQVAALPDAGLALDTAVELATLKGVATLENQGTYGGILVEVVGRATTAITNSGGEYQLSVPEGSYDLRFVRADFVTTTVTGISATLGAAVEVPPVELPVNPATVQGQVVAETLAGGTAPLANALVTLEGTSSTGLTGADGSFALTGVYAGSYLLRVVKTGYLDASTPVIGLAGGEVRTLSSPVSVELARGGISGTVQLADDADASGAIVEATGTGVATVTGASGAFTLSGLVEGTYEVTLRKDGYAAAVRSSVNVTAGSTTSIGTVTLARQGGTIAVAQGAVTGSRDITVQLNAAIATGYRISEDPTFTSAAAGDTLTVPATPRPYSGPGSTHAFTLGDLDGRHSVYVIFYDGASPSSPSSASVVLDRLAPSSPSVAVDDGAPFTRNTVVALALSAQDLPAAAGAEVSGLAQVQIANNPSFTGATTLAFAVSTTWSIGAGDGAKTVYVRFTDKAGNVSSAAQGSITLDTVAPTAGSVALSGGTSAPAGFTGSPLVTATLAATDANAGPGGANLQVKLSNSSGLGGSSFQPFASTVPWFVSAGDGLKTVYAQFLDPAGNQSVVANGTITLAATPPSSGTVVVEGGAAATRKATVGVAVSAAGATQMRLSLNGVDATGWIPYATSTTLDVSAAPDEAVASVSVNFRNAASVEGGSASTSILIDRRAPTSPSLQISGGAPFAGSTAVALDVSAVESPAAAGQVSGLDRVEVAGNAAFTGSTFFPYGATVPWTLPSGDGAKTVYARFLDRAGNVSAAVSDTIVLDTTAPASPTLALTGNPEATAGNTGTPIVTASLNATDANEGAGKTNLEMRVSNDLGFAGSSWQPYASSLAWVLPPGDALKTVYAQFRDRAGNVSATASATITLLSTPPTSGSLIIAGGAAATATQTVSLAISATGAAQMRLFVNGAAATGWVPYATSTTVDLGATPNEATRVVSVGFRNAGGVEGGGTSAAIRFDTIAPGAGTLAVVGTLGNGTTSASLSATPAVVLQITPPSGSPDVTQMALVQATTAATACSAMFASPQWQPVALTTTFVLTGTDGAKRTCVLFRDAAGNFSTASAVAAGITLDTTPPTNPAFVNVTSTTQNVALAPRTGSPTLTAATDTNGVTYQCVGGISPGYGAQWADCGGATTLPRPWNLIANSENTLGVRARDNAYNYSPGSFARIVHDDVAPTPPFIVELRSSRDSVTVIWDATADVDVADYLVYYGNSPGDLAGTGAAQGPSPISAGARLGQASGSFTLTGLTQGIPYYVAVEAVDAAGNRSGPSGERSAVPNRANPRMITTFGATPRTTGFRATAAKTFVYVGTNQGITQVDITDDIFPSITGRAFLPDMVPVERAKLAVFDCTKGAAQGHCVVPTGTTLEGDYRNDQDFYRAAAPIVFFPLTGSATAPVVGLIESILPVRPTHVVPYTTGGITYLAAVDSTGVRVFTLSPTNPSLVRQVASTTHSVPVVEVTTAGLNGSELYVVAHVDPRWFGGPSDYPLVLGYELADAPAGDTYELFSPHQLNGLVGGVIGDRTAPGPEPVFMADGGLYALYTAAGVTYASSYNPAAAAPVSTVTVIGSAGSDGGYPAAGAAGFGQLYLWTQGGLGNPVLTQVNVSGFTLALGGTRTVGNEPFAAQVARTHAAATRLLTIDPYTSDPAVRSVQRWAVTGATIANGSGLFNQIRPEWFAWADHVMYVSQAGFINRVDVSNPYLPIIGNAFTPGAAIGGSYGRLLVHGRYLFAAFSPSILPGSGGVAIFRMTGTGGLQTNGNFLNPAPMRTLSFPVGVNGNDMAVVGRWLFATGSDGDIRVYDLAPTTALNNPANSVPTLVTTLVGSYGEIEARRDFSTLNYEAVVYATVGDTLVTLGWNGASFTTLNAGVTFASSQAATSLDLAGYYATVGTPAGSYLFGIATPSSPGVFSTPYPIAGPTKLQGGYLVGLSPDGDPSGPNFTGRSAGAVDGSIRFSTCTGGTARSLAHDSGLYAASCGRNGIALFSPDALEGMRLMKSYDVSATGWNGGAAFATDGMINWLGGPQIWNGSATDSSKLYLVDEQTTAEGPLQAPVSPVSINGGDLLRGARFMAEADGVLYVATARVSQSPTIDAYEATTPYTFLGRYTFVGTDNVGAMVTDGEYLYVARNGNSTQIQVIDVRNPAAMALRASSSSVANRVISSLALSRDRLYAPLYQGAAQVNDILVWDVSLVQSAGTVTQLTTIGAGSEGTITGVDVVGSTIVWTVYDPIYSSPLYGLGIGTLGAANRDGSGFIGKPLISVSEPPQSPVIAGDQLYVAANLGLQAWDMRGWWSSGAGLNPGGGVSLADPLRLDNPVKLHIEGPFAYLTGGIFRSFDLR
jgi:hypothetical protein